MGGEPAPHPRGEPHVIMVREPLDAALDSLCWSLVRFLCIYVREGHWCVVSLRVFGFGIGAMLALRDEFMKTWC